MTMQCVNLFTTDIRTLTNQYRDPEAGFSAGMKVRARFALITVLKGITLSIACIAAVTLTIPVLPFTGFLAADLLEASTTLIRITTLCFIGIFSPSEAFIWFNHEVVFADPTSTMHNKLSNLNELRTASSAYLCESTEGYVTRIFRNLLESQGLTLHTLTSDGSCLFSAIADQAPTYHPEMDIVAKTAQLRQDTIAYLRAQRDDLTETVLLTLQDLVIREEYISPDFEPDVMIIRLQQTYRVETLAEIAGTGNLQSRLALVQALQENRARLEATLLPPGIPFEDYCTLLAQADGPAWYLQQMQTNEVLRDFVFNAYCQRLRGLTNTDLMYELGRIPAMKASLYESYCATMAEANAWGPGPEIRVIAAVLNRTIHVYSPQSIRARRPGDPMPFDRPDAIAPLIICEQGPTATPPIRIFYNGHDHYESCRSAQPNP